MCIKTQVLSICISAMNDDEEESVSCVCRFCFKNASFYINMLGQIGVGLDPSDKEVPNIVMACFSIKIFQVNSHPQFICHSCLLALETLRMPLNVDKASRENSSSVKSRTKVRREQVTVKTSKNKRRVLEMSQPHGVSVPSVEALSKNHRKTEEQTSNIVTKEKRQQNCQSTPTSNKKHYLKISTKHKSKPSPSHVTHPVSPSHHKNESKTSRRSCDTSKSRGRLRKPTRPVNESHRQAKCEANESSKVTQPLSESHIVNAWRKDWCTEPSNAANVGTTDRDNNRGVKQHNKHNTRSTSDTTSSNNKTANITDKQNKSRAPSVGHDMMLRSADSESSFTLPSVVGGSSSRDRSDPDHVPDAWSHLLASSSSSGTTLTGCTVSARKSSARQFLEDYVRTLHSDKTPQRNQPHKQSKYVPHEAYSPASSNSSFDTILHKTAYKTAYTTPLEEYQPVTETIGKSFNQQESGFFSIKQTKSTADTAFDRLLNTRSKR